jgi:hypothetical protein
MPDTKQLVMTIQGSSPVTATAMTTPNTPSLLFFYFLNGLAQYRLSLTHSGVYLCISQVSYDFLCFFLHTSHFSNTLLCLFFFMGFDSAPQSSLEIFSHLEGDPVVFIDCTGPSLYGISVIFTDSTEMLSFSFLYYSPSLLVCVSLYVPYA